jgi:hypothetical protein
MIHNYAPTPAGDGSPVYMMPADWRRKMMVAAWLQQAWRMDLHPQPPLGYTDFLGARHGRPCCWVVVITRSYTYPQLMAMGGIFLKWRTWATLRALAAVPLSVTWLGCYVVWDLADGIYANHIANLPEYLTTAYDPRGAANDTEPAVLVLDLVRV